jgi:hypothetical protein
MDQDSRTSFPDKGAFAAADKAVSIMRTLAGGDHLAFLADTIMSLGNCPGRHLTSDSHFGFSVGSRSLLPIRWTIGCVRGALMAVLEAAWRRRV